MHGPPGLSKEPTTHRMPHRPPARSKRTNHLSDAASSTSAAPSAPNQPWDATSSTSAAPSAPNQPWDATSSTSGAPSAPNQPWDATSSTSAAPSAPNQPSDAASVHQRRPSAPTSQWDATSSTGVAQTNPNQQPPSAPSSLPPWRDRRFHLAFPQHSGFCLSQTLRELRVARCPHGLLQPFPTPVRPQLYARAGQRAQLLIRRGIIRRPIHAPPLPPRILHHRRKTARPMKVEIRVEISDVEI